MRSFAIWKCWVFNASALSLLDFSILSNPISLFVLLKRLRLLREPGVEALQQETSFIEYKNVSTSHILAM